jgi:hypothetical protein
MYKAQYKTHNPFESWSTLGTYSSEQAAISAALTKKNHGAIMVRVTDKSGSVVYSS